MLRNICRALLPAMGRPHNTPLALYCKPTSLPLFLFSKIKHQATQVLDLDHFVKSDSTIKILKDKGISTFFPIQAETYQHIYQGKDVIAGDKTGSGKTIAFTLPIIERMRANNLFKAQRGIKFVVLAPTRELAVQIGTEIESLKHNYSEFRVLTVFGGSSVFNNQRDLRRNPDILVGTPGRIIDLMERGLLDFRNVSTACVDEADYMFDIGFQEHLNAILSQIKKTSTKKCQYLCFSATLNNQVVSLTNKYMGLDKVTIKMFDENDKRTPATILHYYLQVDERKKMAAVRELIKQKSNGGRVIIFTNTKREATSLGEQLGVDSVVLHGDIEQRKRFQRLRQFKLGDVKLLIASDVAARGLDIPNVELVINYDAPKSTQGYIHRTGRTGRAGKQGMCATLLSPYDGHQIIKQIQREITIPITRLEFKQNKIVEMSVENYEPQIRSRNRAPSNSRSSFSPRTNFNSSPRTYNREPTYNRESTSNYEPAERREPTNEGQFSDTDFILFDNKNNLNKNEIESELQQNKINYNVLKEVMSSKSGSKFYLLNVQDKAEGDKILKLRVGSLAAKFIKSKTRVFK